MFRVVEGFLVQFGITNNVTLNREWRNKGPIKDDPALKDPKLPFKRGYVSFAGGGPHSRTTQTFIAFKDSDFLGQAPWETPFGYVNAKDMKKVVDRFYSGYGDMQDFGGRAPEQGRIANEGGRYLESEFPDIDYIEDCVMGRSFKAKKLIHKAEEKLGRFWSVVVVFAAALALLAVISFAARLAMSTSNKRD